jgi:hypothetical protein
MANDQAIYEVYAITEMTNSITKIIDHHRIIKLAHIQFDIAVAYHISLQGNRYFFLIIDSLIWRNWGLGLKEKNNILGALEN